ncbi:hypothetical protein GWI33_021063 [Rhynchophorus ferrugineus]|uniref:Uncharacterized protein n=1 Tax=Rhynchophorus ferrugineus TaxID=354439 RepID=A0A834LZY7_RHYFE|nr:hypothetical protein GWI33_021063 [Rhynchophorus ferrugineus]
MEEENWTRGGNNATLCVLKMEENITSAIKTEAKTDENWLNYDAITSRWVSYQTAPSRNNCDAVGDAFSRTRSLWRVFVGPTEY